MKLWQFAVCGLLAAGSLAEAQAPSRVAVVRSESDDRLLRDAGTRLRAELLGAGFEVIEVNSAPGDPRADVESAADGGNSFATIALARAGSGAFADIWISDHVTGKTLVRRLEVGEESNAATVLAIRALELLRASLLELATPRPAAEPVVRAPRDVLEWIEPVLPEPALDPRGPFGGTALGVSLLGLHGTRGLGLALGPSLRLSQGFAQHWFGRLSLSGPLFGPEPKTDGGSASVRQEFASLDLGLSSSVTTFGAFCWMGAGVYHLRTVGYAQKPNHATTDDVVSLLTNVGIGAMARLGARTIATVELGLAWMIPYPVVVIANEDAGIAGQPSVSLALGVVVEL
ncbi:MAG TPA: hypothetical protein VJV78_24935 [Polyangiales bacterium]|nr:hypothetical protein [Polyangiales bacterium]